MVELLDLPRDAIGFHYYNWDYLGHDIVDSPISPEACEKTYNYFPEANPCGFDSHYGDYFPARIGFDDAMKSL